MPVYDGQILDAGGAVHNIASTTYGAEANNAGVADAKNINALVAAVGTGHRVVVIPPGTYYFLAISS